MLKIKVYAKINLSLSITGKRENGYHELDMVNSSVNLFDTISLERRADNKVSVKYADNREYEKDIAIKTAKMMVDKYGLGGVDILIDKGIPEKSGLGGSSADASGVIYGMCKLYSLEVDEVDTDDIMSLGSDVLYMLYGGLRRITGIGENISMDITPPEMYFILMCDEAGVDTAKCYKSYDDMASISKVNNQKLIRALIFNDVDNIAKGLSNDLLNSALTLNSNIQNKFNILNSLQPLAVFLTGSGSGTLAWFKTKLERDKNMAILQKNEAVTKYTIYSINNINRGIDILS